MDTNYNRIKVSDLETSAPSKILVTNNKGELEFKDFNILGLEAGNFQKENFEFTGSKIFTLSQPAINVLSVIVDGITLNGTSGAPLQYRMNTPTSLEILDEMVLGEDIWVSITYNYSGSESGGLQGILKNNGEAFLENGTCETDIIFTAENDTSTVVLSGAKGSDVTTLSIDNGIFSLRNKQTGFGYNTLKFDTAQNSSSNNVNILIPSKNLAGDYTLATTKDLSLMVTSNSAPTSATAAGVKGDIRIDNDFVYICVNTNTWKRSALTAW